MKIIQITISVLLLSVNFVFAGSDSTVVAAVNKAVVAIDDSISRGEYKSIKIEEISDVEGNPATLQFYYKIDRLITVQIATGHESWTSEHRYYYYPDEVPMKYLHTIKNRTDNPPRRAIIYNDKGTIVWTNTETKADPISLTKLFKTIQELRLKFSKY